MDSPAIEPERLFRLDLHIIDLDPLDTDEAKNLLSQTVASQVSGHGRRMGITQELRFVLVVDEAHHISPNLRNYLSVLERYALELRKYGMGLVVIATRPTLISENILANCNTVICHQLTGSKDIDLALNYMVNRLEVDRFLAEFRLLDVGDALVQLNDPRMSANPIKFHADVPRELVLSSSLQSQNAPPIATHMQQPSREANRVLPPSEDSAWSIYEKLPPWAREATKLPSVSNGVISHGPLGDGRYSKSNVKEMIQGRYRLFTWSGNALILTRLGHKIAVIHTAVSEKQHE